MVGSDDGRVLGFVRGPACLHHSIEWPESARRLRALARQALGRAGMAETVPVAHAQLYLAGINLPAERDWFTAELTAALADRVAVENDAFAALRAGCAAGPGVAVVCGAGLNCVGRDEAGRTARFCAFGPLTGDWGSGPDLGLAALGHAVRGEDGRAAPTLLSELVAARFRMRSATEVAIAMQTATLCRTRLAELVPLLFDAATGGDEVARGVVHRLAMEIAGMAGSVVRRLEPAGPVPVVLAGGVLRNAPEQVLDQITTLIRRSVPSAGTQVLAASPVLGSALAALDALRARPAAHDRIRRELPELMVSDLTQ